MEEEEEENGRTTVPGRVVVEFAVSTVPGEGALVVLLSVDDARELDCGALLQEHLGRALHPRLLHCEGQGRCFVNKTVFSNKVTSRR